MSARGGVLPVTGFAALARTEQLFRPDRARVADEVRGDLAADKSIKRWLFGAAAGDVEALRNQVPALACLVCVTLRPHQSPEVELAGAPARACYRFAAKVWRTRPDLTNLSIPFKLNFESSVRLLTYQKIGG
jgi:hypothetical protein